MKIKSFFQDVLGSTKVTKRRKEAIKRASPMSNDNDPINEVAHLLHPGQIPVHISKIRDSSLSSKTITLESEDAHFPYFKAGQYLTLTMKIGSSIVSRPYTISSAPFQTRGKKPIVEITIKKKPKNGFVSDFLLSSKVGDSFLAEVGLGQFFYEPLRDSKNVVCIAGGSGITPFASMAKEVKYGCLDIHLVILYGSVDEKDIVLKDELKDFECPQVKIVHVLSGANPDYTGLKGYITADIIREYSPEDSTYFICGPNKMYESMREELKKLNVPERRIRMEVPGSVDDVRKLPDYPILKKDESYHITVKRGISEDVIRANADESILVALERAGIKTHSGCRSGECGFCRIKIEKGDFYLNEQADYRRAADKDFNYVHACSTYPLSDLTIRINID